MADLKFCMHTEGLGPNEIYAKLGHRESGSRELIINFETLLLSMERLQLETGNFAFI